jgi:hypothetical protein
MDTKKWLPYVAAATAGLGVVSYLLYSGTRNKGSAAQNSEEKFYNVLVGDIGGTNVRLRLERVYLEKKTRFEIKK